MNIILRTILIAGSLTGMGSVQAASTITMPLNCGEHDDPCIYGEDSFSVATPHVVIDSDSDFLKENFDTFDTFYFDVEGANRVMRGTITPSVPLSGFEAGIFDNDKDVWWGRFVDLDDDDGTYTLIKTDAEGNYDPDMLMTKIVLPALDIEGPDYHFHFYTNKGSGDPTSYSYEFDVAASAVPLPAAGWMLLTGLVVFGKGLRSTKTG